MRRWTTEEKDYLKRNYERSNEKIAKKLGRTPDSIKGMRTYLGVPAPCWDSYFKPKEMSSAMKILRIEEMAMQMRVKLLG